jgi:hypothetical protein
MVVISNEALEWLDRALATMPAMIGATDRAKLLHLGARVEPVRHRQTKGAATDMFGLPPLRHTPTLPTYQPLKQGLV